jgi:hypothetical protein
LKDKFYQRKKSRESAGHHKLYLISLSALVSANNAGQNTALGIGQIRDGRHAARAEAVAGLAADGLLGRVVELVGADRLALRRVGLPARQGTNWESVQLVQQVLETELHAALGLVRQRDEEITNLTTVTTTEFCPSCTEPRTNTTYRADLRAWDNQRVT